MSIFRLTLKTCPPIAGVAGKAGMQSLRTLRHPHVLACLDSVQLETEYVIATGVRHVLFGGGGGVKEGDCFAGGKCVCVRENGFCWFGRGVVWRGEGRGWREGGGLALPRLGLPCLALPCLAFLALRIHALRCVFMPCVALPSHALPCLALPCLALPFLLIFATSAGGEEGGEA